MTSATYADVLRPQTRAAAWLYDAAMIVGGTVLVALSAQFAFRLPFTPVPITLQTLTVLLVGLLLGSTRGSISMLLYLAQGLAGLPVFAFGGAGAAYFLGPTGGYLIGFVLAAYLTGRLAERGWDRRIMTTILALVVGTVAIYTCGLIWLAVYLRAENVLAVGLYPFIPGALVKIAAAAILYPQGWKLLHSKEKDREEAG
ncbi:MAG: biotin transporter BioY [Fidelibacterota bacterium]|nr:MAG: biotin transporter BioY [Candidatus Neomarinimicrobiota bacterium]